MPVTEPLVTITSLASWSKPVTSFENVAVTVKGSVFVIASGPPERVTVGPETTVIVTVSAVEARPRLSVTMSSKVSVWSASPAARVGAVKVGLAAVASEIVTPAGAVHA